MLACFDLQNILFIFIKTTYPNQSILPGGNVGGDVQPPGSSSEEEESGGRSFHFG